ncbi:MAG: ADP-glyceromanno-heptose 6-epimerase [Candidatus Margulisiibacteriota bacterium]|nr:ADP-glyceromanno-heptose 6-epimerase [Candidatus Margulisiibacteriota bacterium]
MEKRETDSLIILTGGAGFIGSCFLWKLNQMGENNILVVDHMDSDIKKKNLDNKKYADYFEKDAFMKDFQKGKIPEKVKAVFHIGACSSTTETDADYLEKNNYEYSKTLAEWALKENIPFYYASSAATYGDGSLGYSDEDENSLKLAPLNLYGRSKQLFDLWLITNDLSDKVVGFKYFNVFGPNEYHKENMRSLVAKAYEQVKKDGKIRLFRSYSPEYKDGEQKRDFIYVKDAIEVMWWFYEHQKAKGIFNLGTGKAQTWNDLANAIFSALKMGPNIEYIDMPEEIKDKYQYFTQADLSKLNKAGIGHQFSSLKEGVGDYVRNYLEKGCARL